MDTESKEQESEEEEKKKKIETHTHRKKDRENGEWLEDFEGIIKKLELSIFQATEKKRMNWSLNELTLIMIIIHNAHHIIYSVKCEILRHIVYVTSQVKSSE